MSLPPSVVDYGVSKSSLFWSRVCGFANRKYSHALPSVGVATRQPIALYVGS